MQKGQNFIHEHRTNLLPEGFGFDAFDDRVRGGKIYEGTLHVFNELVAKFDHRFNVRTLDARNLQLIARKVVFEEIGKVPYRSHVLQQHWTECVWRE